MIFSSSQSANPGSRSTMNRNGRNRQINIGTAPKTTQRSHKNFDSKENIGSLDGRSQGIN